MTQTPDDNELEADGWAAWSTKDDEDTKSPEEGRLGSRKQEKPEQETGDKPASS
ncbi:hypothetical protein [Flexivirga sp. B27]